MQIDDMTSGGYVRRWTLIDGRPRCVDDAIPASDAGAVAALQRNAGVRLLVAAVEALEAARAAGEPDAADAPAPVLALAGWRAAEPEGGQHETDAMDAAEAEGAPWETARADALAELDRLAALPLEHDPRPVPASVSPLQMRRALRAAGLHEAVAAYLASAPDDVVEAWEYAVEIRADDPMIAAAMAALGRSSSDRYNLFRLAAVQS